MKVLTPHTHILDNHSELARKLKVHNALNFKSQGFLLSIIMEVERKEVKGHISVMLRILEMLAIIDRRNDILPCIHPCGFLKAV